jgi:transposase
MQIIADRLEAPSAIRSDLGAIFISLELSRSTLLITSLSPGGLPPHVKAQISRELD